MTDPENQINPFAAMSLNLKEYYGSRQILELALQAISSEQPKAIEFYGLRGMGRTLLLRHLALDGQIKQLVGGRLDRQKNGPTDPIKTFDAYVPILIECSLIANPANIMDDICDRFEDTLRLLETRPSTPDSAGSEKKQDRLPAGLLDEINIYFNRISQSADRSADTRVADVREFLRQCSKYRTRVAWLIDDIDRFHKKGKDKQDASDKKDDTNSDTPKIPVRFFEQLATWRVYSSFIFCTDQPIHEIYAEGSNWFGKFDAVPFTGLTLDEARTFLQNPVGGTFPPEDVDHVITLVGNIPSLLMRGGKVLWEYRKDLGILAGTASHQSDSPGQSPAAIPLTEAQLDGLTKRLRLETMGRMEGYYQALETAEQKTLLDIVAGKAPERLSIKSLNVLRGNGLVLVENGEFRLVSILFEEYLREELARLKNQPTSEQAKKPLSSTEAKLYRELVLHAGNVVTFADLWKAVWHNRPTTEKEMLRLIQVNVSRIKKKLKDVKDKPIESIRGVGYRYGD